MDAVAHAMEAARLAAFTFEVHAGLRQRQKTLPCKYLYDDVGSALFDAITHLPEYGVTRAEEGLLVEQAPRIVEALVPGVMVAELGSGSGRKTTTILDAILRYQREVAYYPIDISAGALEACRLRIGATQGVRVHGVEGQYLEGLQRLDAGREAWPPALVLFLGSNIGNFGRAEALTFLAGVRRQLRAGDALLVGADLRKPVARLLAAYDDPIGVTAAFNLNLLARINRELGADFDLRRFRHEARWCETESRVEMHLRSLEDQVVTIGQTGVRIPFLAGESIWTESSYKFEPEELDALARSAGFSPVSRWTSGGWTFAESLWVVTATGDE
ncbi:MAG TPA: L-histidine N(alpha)-methyltransferase [Vicinamibacterales bacterium]